MEAAREAAEAALRAEQEKKLTAERWAKVRAFIEENERQ